MNLGENIYKCRTANHLSQGDLAVELEVSRQSVSKWENNSSVPELDKLVKMSRVFDVSLDTLVFGNQIPERSIRPMQQLHIPVRTVIGLLLMLFGMVFFLLSIFWGDHLTLGEEFGELLSISIVLLSVTTLATYDARVWSFCAVLYFVYSLICYGFIKTADLTNDLFVFVWGVVILVWFILWGLHYEQSHPAAPVPSE
ncbi:MAG: helix-turn-helix transcriptional regulator [Clostridia bacterium]|nr:helix-turn-helix transcriptional regulator [Clostridia bacterium]